MGKLGTFKRKIEAVGGTECWLADKETADSQQRGIEIQQYVK
jgi:hypothetical protein